MIHRIVGVAAIATLAASSVACVSGQVANPGGTRAQQVDSSIPGPVSGTGIEGQDIVSMTDEMTRDLLATPVISARQTAPRIVLDSQHFVNAGSQAINRDLITDRLRVSLNRASAGRMLFVTRSNLAVVQQERDLKRDGATDEGTLGLRKSTLGVDFVLTGKISNLDSRNVRTGLTQRYNQIIFEMLEVESGAIVWSGQYEYSRAAADDVVYR